MRVRIFLRRAGRSILLALLVLSGLAGLRAQEEAAVEPGEAGEYVIGVEDELTIRVWKEPDMNEKVTVRPDGKITFSLVGDLQAAGRTATQLTEDLRSALSKYIKEPVVTVIVSGINNFKVYLLGEIAKQGEIVLKRRTRLLEVIALAGGLTQYADKSKLLLIRYDGGRVIRIPIDYRKVASGERLDLNVYLKPGDTIVVQ